MGLLEGPFSVLEYSCCHLFVLEGSVSSISFQQFDFISMLFQLISCDHQVEGHSSLIRFADH